MNHERIITSEGINQGRLTGAAEGTFVNLPSGDGHPDYVGEARAERAEGLLDSPTEVKSEGNGFKTLEAYEAQVAAAALNRARTDNNTKPGAY